MRAEKTPDYVVRVVPRLGDEKNAVFADKDHHLWRLKKRSGNSVLLRDMEKRGPHFRIEPLKQFETNYTPAGEA